MAADAPPGPGKGLLPLPAGSRPSHLPLLPVETVAAARQLAADSAADNTKRAYASDWQNFLTWCAEQKPQRGSMPASPETLALYFTSMLQMGYAMSTIKRAKSTISQAHRMKGITPNPAQDPVVQKVVQGITRRLGTAPKNAKDPITKTELRQLLDVVGPGTDLARGRIAGVQEIRDRAILLLGFALAARRSELAALKLSDIQVMSRIVDGKPQTYLLVRSVHSKTNQSGEVRHKVVGRAKDPTLCPVAAVEQYLTLRQNLGVTDPALFLALTPTADDFTTGLTPDGQDIARIVKRYAKKAGLDPKKFAGHSLRSGFVTEAFMQGLDLSDIMDTTEHQTVEMLRRYDRRTGASKKPKTDKLL